MYRNVVELSSGKSARSIRATYANEMGDTCPPFRPSSVPIAGHQGAFAYMHTIGRLLLTLPIHLPQANRSPVELHTQSSCEIILAERPAVLELMARRSIFVSRR